MKGSGLMHLVKRFIYIILILSFVGCAKQIPTDMREAERKLEREEAFPDLSFESASPKRRASLQYTREGKHESDRGMYLKAMKRYEKAIDIDPTNPYAYYHYGIARYSTREHEQSLRLLDQAREKFGENEKWLSRIYNYRGLNYRAMGMFEEAIESFRQAISLDKKNQEAKENLRETLGEE